MAQSSRLQFALSVCKIPSYIGAEQTMCANFEAHLLETILVSSLLSLNILYNVEGLGRSFENDVQECGRWEVVIHKVRRKVKHFTDNLSPFFQ
jgi:hypothetical protein